MKRLFSIKLRISGTAQVLIVAGDQDEAREIASDLPDINLDNCANVHFVDTAIADIKEDTSGAILEDAFNYFDIEDD